MPSAEDIIQIQVCEWVKQVAKIPVIAIANQRRCSPQYGRMLKRMGVKAGVSDLFFPRSDHRGLYKGLWLELKTDDGKASKEQSEFIREMFMEGYDGRIVFGSEQAINAIKQFYHLP